MFFAFTGQIVSPDENNNPTAELWIITGIGFLFHCVESVHIQSYSGPHFPSFGLNTERHEVTLRIQSKCGKIRTRITPNTDTFHAVFASNVWRIPLAEANLRSSQTT